MNGTTFGRFVIAPSDPELVANGTSSTNQPPALQCAALGAFGGFFEREFRAHDYILGRRNCQKFLRDYFVLPADNVIMKPALESLHPDTNATVVAKFKRPAPGTYAESAASLAQKGEAVPYAQKTSTDTWIPIIPLCSEIVSKPIEPIARARMTSAALTVVVDLILQRFRALVPLLLKPVGNLPASCLPPDWSTVHTLARAQSAAKSTD